MIKESFSKYDKIDISKKIKDISIVDLDKDFLKLKAIGNKANTISERSKIGNNVVDYFTFVQRLETKGKYDVNYFDFLQNLDTFKEKKFIQNTIVITHLPQTYLHSFSHSLIHTSLLIYC